jgi:hypothetical protein
MEKQYRQGDVLVEGVNSIPKEATMIVDRENGRVVLAHGEVTCHAHAIADHGVTLRRVPTAPGVSYLEIAEALAMLTHQEHATVALPTGVYRVERQREYAPAAIRNVAD